MATKKPTQAEKLLTLTRKQNSLIDDAVAELRGHIEAALGRSLPKVQSWLGERLAVVADLIEPTRQTQATLRLTMRQIVTETLKRGKLDAQIEAWAGTFGRQMPLFDDVLKLMGLPAMDWRKPDREWLTNSILSAQDQVKGVIESAARAVQEQALYSYNGLKLSRLYELMQTRMAMAPAAAVNVADTSATVFLRQVHERGYARIEETQGTPLRYRFYGPDDKLERPFCHALHQGKAIDRASGKRRIFAPASTAPDGSYTRAEIATMDNGQLPNVILTGGGYRCRHQWVMAALAPVPAAKAEPPKWEPRTFADERESDAYLRATAQPWRAQLTAPQRDAVRAYTDDAYFEVNAALRNGTPLSAARKAMVEHLDSASLFPLPDDVELLRGLMDRPFTGQRPGDIIEWRAYTSTSLLKAFEGQTQIVIRAPRGTRVAPIDGESGLPVEQEVLLPRGSRVRVITVSTSGSIDTVVVEIVQ